MRGHSKLAWLHPATPPPAPSTTTEQLEPVCNTRSAIIFQDRQQGLTASIMGEWRGRGSNGLGGQLGSQLPAQPLHYSWYAGLELCAPSRAVPLQLLLVLPASQLDAPPATLLTPSPPRVLLLGPSRQVGSGCRGRKSGHRRIRQNRDSGWAALWQRRCAHSSGRGRKAPPSLARGASPSPRLTTCCLRLPDCQSKHSAEHPGQAMGSTTVLLSVPPACATACRLCRQRLPACRPCASVARGSCHSPGARQGHARLGAGQQAGPTRAPPARHRRRRAVPSALPPAAAAAF